MFDDNLMLRKTSDGALSASETSATGVDYGAGDREPLTYILKIPSVSGTSPTLVAAVQESADNTNWHFVGYFKPDGADAVINAVGIYYVTLRCNERYRRRHLTLGGTTPNFGTATLGPDLGGDYNKF